MTPSDSLHLDEHLARLLAAYDQGIGEADGKAPTIPVPPTPAGADADASAPDEPGPDDTLAFYPEPVATLPAVPPRIGRFELRRQLGKGGCGIVFLAYDPKLKREVALKIPRPEMLLSADTRRRLIREARAAAEFDHPNLVPVYETGEIGPLCFIATAFCPGQTLAEWLDRQAFPVPVRQAARLIARVADAVQHAHDRGVLHRDLKPNNVILQETKFDPFDQGPPAGSCPLRGEHFVPRVVDFGLAKVSESGPTDTVTRQVLGTPKYMAPEQAQARHEDVGPQADVYALGVVLYELLTGRPPYDGPTDVEVLRQAVEGHLTPPHAFRTDLPRDLEAICLKAMARTPGKRYRTAIDFADDLRRFLDGLPTLARPLNRVGRSARWLRRNDQAVALVVVTTLALYFLVVGSWNLVQSQQLRTDRDTAEAERVRHDRQRSFARHARDAFLSWRAGDAQQMTVSLAAARSAAALNSETPGFAWDYLSQLGRVERLSAACPAGAVAAVAVSPDGRLVATAHPTGTLTVWDRQSGKPLGTAKAHPPGAAHVAFLSNGSVVTAGGEAGIRAWNLSSTGEPVAGRVASPFPDAVTALAASADGTRVYAGSASGMCACWDVPANRVIKTWAATDDEPVVALAVSPDGLTLASGGRNEPVRLWEAATHEPAGEVRGSAGGPALAFAPAKAGGWLLLSGGADGAVRVFDRQGREARTLSGHSGPVLSLAVSPDGTSIASGGDDAAVHVWDVATGATRALLRGHDRAVRGIRFGPDGRTLVTGGDDGFLKVWDLTADPEGPTIRGLPAAVSGLAVHPSGQGFAVALADGSVQVYTHRGDPPRRFPRTGHGPVGVLRFPEIGPPVGVELAGRSALVWEFGPTPRLLLRADVGGESAKAADLSAAPDAVAVGDDRGRVAVWSLADQTRVAEVDTGLGTPVWHLSLSDDGKQVAAPTAGGVIGVWAVGGGDNPAFRVPGHGDGLWLVRFLPGGGRLVTAGRGSSIKVWGVAAGREELALLGHVGRVTGLAVSPDGRTLVSGSNTGEVKLWDLRTGVELVGLRRHTGPVTAAEFAANGRLLVTGGTPPGGTPPGGRGELALWDASKEP